MKNEVVGLLAQVLGLTGEDLPIGASDSEINDFSFSNGIDLPKDLREWLSVCNGAVVGVGGQVLLGIQPVNSSFRIDKVLAFHPNWKTNQWLPIACDSCGNYYVIDLSSAGQAPVYFMDHETSGEEPIYTVASDLWHFLWFLFRDEILIAKEIESGWPFDREYVLRNDSEIATSRGLVPFPWEE